jgi:hypothetical protein
MEMLKKEFDKKASLAHGGESRNIHAIRAAVLERKPLTGLKKGDVLRQKKFGKSFRYKFYDNPVVFVRYTEPGERMFLENHRTMQDNLFTWLSEALKPGQAGSYFVAEFFQDGHSELIFSSQLKKSAEGKVSSTSERRGGNW